MIMVKSMSVTLCVIKTEMRFSKVTIAKDGWVAIDTPVMTAESCLIEDVDRIDNKDAFLF